MRPLIDVSATKLALAKECGADLTINVAEEDAIGIVMGLTDGYGALYFSQMKSASETP